MRNALSQEVATQYDPGCGKLLWQTITYASGQSPTAQPRTEHQYDTFCRLSATALPDESLSAPHRRYVYYLGAARQATDVFLSEAIAGATTPTGWIWRDDLSDALGRHVQTQQDGVVDGVKQTVGEGTVTFDSRGNVGSRYAPWTMTQSFSYGAAVYQAPPTGTGVTALLYDALNRVTKVTNPDTSQQTALYNIAWQTTTKDECYNAPSCTGGITVEKRDAFGRTTEKQLI